MNARLNQQVERILDERPDKTVGVIVHMADPAGDQDGVLAAVLNRREHSALTARAVLPEAVRASRAAAITNGANGAGCPACVRTLRTLRTLRILGTLGTPRTAGPTRRHRRWRR